LFAEYDENQNGSLDYRELAKVIFGDQTTRAQFNQKPTATL
jgi:Ca2+-binding EF-hand superfamily protein